MSTTTDLEVFSRTGFSVVVTPAAESLKAEALEASALVARVTTDEENEIAAAALVKLKTVSREVEKARKAVKEPFFDACRSLDAKAKVFSKELLEEEHRLGRLSADFETENRENFRRIEAARAAEAERIERERRAEEERIWRAAEEAAVNAKTAAEVERIRQEAEAKAKAETERAAQALEAAAPPAPVIAKVKGVSARPEWDFEVTDVWTLARLHPGLVTVTPNRREILDVIASGVREIKGIRIFEKTQLTVRTAHSKAIEV